MLHFIKNMTRVATINASLLALLLVVATAGCEATATLDFEGYEPVDVGVEDLDSAVIVEVTAGVVNETFCYARWDDDGPMYQYAAVWTVDHPDDALIAVDDWGRWTEWRWPTEVRVDYCADLETVNYELSYGEVWEPPEIAVINNQVTVLIDADRTTDIGSLLIWNDI